MTKFQTASVIFDLVKYNSQVHPLSSGPDESYFYVDQLEDGIYFWPNNYIRPRSIFDMLETSIIKVRQNKIYAINKNSPIFGSQHPQFIQNIIFDNGHPIGNFNLPLLIKKFDKEYTEITKIFATNRIILVKSINNQLNELINRFFRFRNTFFGQLFLSLFYWLKGDSAKAKNYILSSIKFVSENDQNRYSEYLNEIYLFYSIKRSVEFTGFVSILSPSVLSLFEDKDKFNKLYIDRLFENIQYGLQSTRVIRINGNRDQVMEKLTASNPTILVLYGHGNPKFGYAILDGNNDRKNTEYFNSDDLQYLLKRYSKDINFTLLDCVCSKGYYRNSNYKFPVEYISNWLNEDGNFDYPSAYFYSIGFFYAYNGFENIDHAHNMGLLLLSLTSEQYLSTFSIETIPFE